MGSAEGFAPLRALSGTLRRLHVDTTDTVWPPFLSELTALVALRIVNGNCMDVEDEEQSLKSLEAALPELTSLTVLELIDVVSGVPPAGLTACPARRPTCTTASALPACRVCESATTWQRLVLLVT